MSNRPNVVRFADYAVTRVLARGGMADIYRVRALADPDGPWLALKLMRFGVDDPEMREALFAREVEIAARLDHPNVVRVRAHGVLEKRPYLVMDHLAGRDAETFVSRAGDRPLPFELVVALGAQAARGLGHAHRRAAADGTPMGIVHRDVSPGNLRMDWTGRLKVLDFGVARVSDPRNRLTKTGTLRGKYAYMSPEQTSGDELDARSDVFSLGVVLYELLTGRRAFLRAGPVETMQAIRNDRLPLPGQLRKGLPSRIDHLLARCLGKDPRLRFPDGIAMADAFDELLDDLGFDGRGGWSEYLATAFRHEREAEARSLEEEEEAFRGFLAAPTPPVRVPSSGLVGRSLLRTDEPRPRARVAPWAVAAVAAGALLGGLGWWWAGRGPSDVRRVDPIVIEAPSESEPQPSSTGEPERESVPRPEG